MFFVLTSIQNKKKDIHAFIDQYSKVLMRLCYLYLKDYHLAEEAVQDALYNAYTKYGSFRSESSEKTWITRIAINICKSYMRKSSYKEIADNNQVSLQYISSDELTYAFRNEEAISLLNSVYNLPTIYKQVILLHYYLDLSINEMAKIIHEKENTVSVRLKRAKEMLKNDLKEEQTYG